MFQLIDEITQALKVMKRPDLSELSSRLNESSALNWKSHYPVALVHSKQRLKDTALIRAFEEHALFDGEGKTPQCPTVQELELISKLSNSALKSVGLACLKELPSKPLCFKPKRAHDYWKKIEDVQHIKAILEFDLFTGKSTLCEAEFLCREVIRKRKEVPSISQLPFIWIAAIPEGADLTPLFKHYFHENHHCIKNRDQNYYIGWSESIQTINMRDFICPPE